MSFSLAHSRIAWLALVAYLIAGIGGAPIVLCEGSDGHRAIEIAHSEGACSTEARGSFGPSPAYLEAAPQPRCEDTLLSSLAPVASSPMRVTVDVSTDAAPALPDFFSTVRPRAPQTDRLRLTSTPAPHLDFEAVRSVVLLI